MTFCALHRLRQWGRELRCADSRTAAATPPQSTCQITGSGYRYMHLLTPAGPTANLLSTSRPSSGSLQPVQVFNLSALQPGSTSSLPTEHQGPASTSPSSTGFCPIFHPSAVFPAGHPMESSHPPPHACVAWLPTLLPSRPVHWGDSTPHCHGLKPVLQLPSESFL